VNVSPLCAVTTTLKGLAPTASVADGEAEPLATGVPLTTTVASGSATVGVRLKVSISLPTDTW